MIDDDKDDVDECLHKMSHILNECKSYSSHEFNREQADSVGKYGIMLFQNIDGNKSNFDSLSVELERFAHKFSIISLAKTNICKK